LQDLVKRARMPDKFQGWPKEFEEFEEFELLGNWQEQILCPWSRHSTRTPRPGE
jgi:hypothetical protein